MNNYEELIKRLRDIARSDIKSNYIGFSLLRAADAIEELTKESERWQAEAKNWYLAYMGLLPTREEEEQ